MTSDQGLSIFDDNEPDEDGTAQAADDATQVMPAVPPRQQAPQATPAPAASRGRAP